MTFAPPGQTGKPPQRCAECRELRRRANSAQRTRAWREANPERAREIARRSLAKRHQDPEVLRLKREREMLRKYGITREGYDRLLEEQDGVCAICRGPRRGPGATFHVDHCHSSNRVRGLLCGPCNTAIGLLGDDPERLERAAAYLRR